MSGALPVNILVSACLLGVDCRYCGTACPGEGIKDLVSRYRLIPVCPEQLGGLPTPRPPAEIRGGRVITASGSDVTEAYCRGAGEVLKLAKLFDCRCAVLKSRSPSCGFGQIYDGTFSGSLVPGNGITADLLHKAGLTVLNEENARAELERLASLPENHEFITKGKNREQN
jgi:uncharacterized protein YbbK (DUF523 family)